MLRYQSQDKHLSPKKIDPTLESSSSPQMTAISYLFLSDHDIRRMYQTNLDRLIDTKGTTRSSYNSELGHISINIQLFEE
jgi:hypothetical protein